MKKLALLLLISSLSNLTFAQDEEADDLVYSIMVVSKMTGMCGIVKQMASFQETTKMNGGDKFMVRFWKTEAARLGLTLEEFVEQCNVVIEKYAGYQEIFNIDP